MRRTAHNQRETIDKSSFVVRNPQGSNLNIKDRHVVDGVDTRITSPDNVYVDVQVINPSATDIMIAQYSTTRSNPIVSKASDYYLSVARFEIPNNNIPLFIFKDNTYGITMVNGAVSNTTYLSYVSPPGNIPGAIYAVQTFLDSLNDALTASATAVGIPDIPRAYFDRTTQLQGIKFSDNANWLGAGGTQTWQLWMNWELFYFFQTMQVYFAGSFDVPSSAYNILVKNNFNGNYVPLTGYDMTQETPLLSLYVSVMNIIIATTSLPVNAELIALKKGDTSSTFNTIADFAPGQLANYSDNFTPYLYNPSFYRLIDLLSQAQINKFDFQIYYTDADGNISPLYLLPTQRMTIKFIFVKKALFNNEYN